MLSTTFVASKMFFRMKCHGSAWRHRQTQIPDMLTDQHGKTLCAQNDNSQAPLNICTFNDLRFQFPHEKTFHSNTDIPILKSMFGE